MANLHDSILLALRPPCLRYRWYARVIWRNIWPKRLPGNRCNTLRQQIALLCVHSCNMLIMCTNCSDSLQRQIAWCERQQHYFSLRNLYFVAATEFCRFNMSHKISQFNFVRQVASTKFCRGDKVFDKILLFTR